MGGGAVVLGPTGTREVAFMYAVSSAGMVHTLARACSQGELDTCSCDPHKTGTSSDSQGSFSWGGCSDNINFAVSFARAFIDAQEWKQRDARALMNLHNNRVGRKVPEPPAHGNMSLIFRLKYTCGHLQGEIGSVHDQSRNLTGIQYTMLP